MEKWLNYLNGEKLSDPLLGQSRHYLLINPYPRNLEALVAARFRRHVVLAVLHGELGGVQSRRCAIIQSPRFRVKVPNLRTVGGTDTDSWRREMEWLSVWFGILLSSGMGNIYSRLFQVLTKRGFNSYVKYQDSGVVRTSTAHSFVSMQRRTVHFIHLS